MPFIWRAANRRRFVGPAKRAQLLLGRKGGGVCLTLERSAPQTRGSGGAALPAAPVAFFGPRIFAGPHLFSEGIFGSEAKLCRALERTLRNWRRSVWAKLKRFPRFLKRGRRLFSARRPELILGRPCLSSGQALAALVFPVLLAGGRLSPCSVVSPPRRRRKCSPAPFAIVCRRRLKKFCPLGLPSF